MTYMQSNEDERLQDAIEMDHLYDDEVGQPFDFGERIASESSSINTYMEDDAAMEESIIQEADSHSTLDPS